jgi:hypothetical protein
MKKEQEEAYVLEGKSRGEFFKSKLERQVEEEEDEKDEDFDIEELGELSVGESASDEDDLNDFQTLKANTQAKFSQIRNSN